MTQAPKCLTTDWILGAFEQRKKTAQRAYRAFIADGRGQPSPWEQLKNQIYLGSEQFIEDMQTRIEPQQSLEDIPKPQKQALSKPLDYYSRNYSDRNEAMAEAYRCGHYIFRWWADTLLSVMVKSAALPRNIMCKM